MGLRVGERGDAGGACGLLLGRLEEGPCDGLYWVDSPFGRRIGRGFGARAEEERAGAWQAAAGRTWNDRDGDDGDSFHRLTLSQLTVV